VTPDDDTGDHRAQSGGAAARIGTRRVAPAPAQAAQRTPALSAGVPTVLRQRPQRHILQLVTRQVPQFILQNQLAFNIKADDPRGTLGWVHRNVCDLTTNQTTPHNSTSRSMR